MISQTQSQQEGCHSFKRIKDEKLAKVFPNWSYHHLMTIEQAEPAVIRVNNTDCQKRVIIKQVRKSESFIHQVPVFTCDQIVNIEDMYIENDDVVFIYKQMDVSLQHKTGILQDQLLKAFQIVAICWEVSTSVDEAETDHAHE